MVLMVLMVWMVWMASMLPLGVTSTNRWCTPSRDMLKSNGKDGKHLLVEGKEEKLRYREGDEDEGYLTRLRRKNSLKEGDMTAKTAARSQRTKE